MLSDFDEGSPRDEPAGLQMIPSEMITDLAVRFLVNLPASETSSWERLIAHVEEAYYFYCDQVVPAAAEISDDIEDSPRGEESISSPSDSFASDIRKIRMIDTVRRLHIQYASRRAVSCADLFPYLSFESFTTQLLSRALQCSLDDVMDGLRVFGAYKKTVNVCGVILLNKSKTHVLAISATTHSRLYFPKGKIMKDESDYACALREAREEIGVDLSDYLAACPIVVKHHKNFPPYRFFAAVGPWEVNELHVFNPQCTGEIHEIRWIDIRLLRAEFFRRGIIHRLRKKYAANGAAHFDRDAIERHVALQSRVATAQKFPFDRRRLSWMVNFYEEICTLRSR